MHNSDTSKTTDEQANVKSTLRIIADIENERFRLFLRALLNSNLMHLLKLYTHNLLHYQAFWKFQKIL